MWMSIVDFVPLYSSFSSGPAVFFNLTLVKSSVLASPAIADAARLTVCLLPGGWSIQKDTLTIQAHRRIIAFNRMQT